MTCFGQVGVLDESLISAIAMGDAGHLLVFPSVFTGYVERWDLLTLTVVDATYAPIVTSSILTRVAVAPGEVMWYLRRLGGGICELRSTSPGGTDTFLQEYDFTGGSVFPQLLAWSTDDSQLYALFVNGLSDIGFYGIDSSDGTMTLIVDQGLSSPQPMTALTAPTTTIDGAIWWLTSFYGDSTTRVNRYHPTDGYHYLDLTPFAYFTDALIGPLKADPTQIFATEGDTGLLGSFAYSAGTISLVSSDLCGGSFLTDPQYPYGNIGIDDTLTGVWPSLDYSQVMAADSDEIIWLWGYGDQWHVGAAKSGGGWA